jgi:transcriptional regulator with XRE-family HTH domain
MKENLSQYVQRVMRQKKLSLSDVARNSGDQIAGSYVGRIIKGTVTNLTVEKIEALALGLDVDAYEIFTASVGRPPHAVTEQPAINPTVFADAVQKLLLDPDLLEIVQLCGNMTEKQRRALLTSLKYMDKPKQKPSKKKKR